MPNCAYAEVKMKMPKVMLAIDGAAKTSVRIILISEGESVVRRTMRSARTQRSQRTETPSWPARSICITVVAMSEATDAQHEKATRKKSKAFHGERMYSRNVCAVILTAAYQSV